MAEEDLQAATLATRDPGFVARIPCYLAEQAAEKAIKAGLTALGVPFRWIHDLDALALALPPTWAIHQANLRSPCSRSGRRRRAPRVPSPIRPSGRDGVGGHGAARARPHLRRSPGRPPPPTAGSVAHPGRRQRPRPASAAPRPVPQRLVAQTRAWSLGGVRTPPTTFGSSSSRRPRPPLGAMPEPEPGQAQRPQHPQRVRVNRVKASPDGRRHRGLVGGGHGSAPAGASHSPGASQGGALAAVRRLCYMEHRHEGRGAGAAPAGERAVAPRRAGGDDRDHRPGRPVARLAPLPAGRPLDRLRAAGGGRRRDRRAGRVPPPLVLPPGWRPRRRPWPVSGATSAEARRASGVATYLDASAVVTLAVQEPDSAALRRSLRRRRPLVSSARARAEVPRALLPGSEAVQTAVAQGTPVPPAVQTQVALAQSLRAPVCPAPGDGPAHRQRGHSGAIGRGRGPRRLRR